MNIITETDRYLFGQGSHYAIYEKLGSHVMEIDGVRGTYFAVWAPHAVAVSVVGDFNDWNGYIHIMERLGTSGIWERFVPGACEGSIYKLPSAGPQHLLPPRSFCESTHHLPTHSHPDK